MSSSASRLIPGLAAGAGVAACTMPLLAPWHLLTVAVAALAMTLCAAPKVRPVVILLGVASLFLVLLGHLPSPLAASVLAASALGLTRRLGLAVSILFLNLSTIGSAQALLSDALNVGAMEAAAPALLASFALIVADCRRPQVLISIFGGGLSALAVWVSLQIAKDPASVLALGALPITIAAILVGSVGEQARRYAFPVAFFFCMALATWVGMPPRTTQEIWILLPDAPDAYEAGFFANYVESLKFAGVQVKQAATPEAIPSGSTLLLPWLTAALPGEERIGRLARERRWTVIAAAEHTNYGDVATRINALAGRHLLRRDLTSPPGNTDDSGPLRMPSLQAWPHETTLNRGASVAITSLADKILLQGDGWWAEPDLKEWLWVGDYVWRWEDRAGRLALAVVSDIEGARWIVIGDNSLLVNQQLIADPRGFMVLLQAASLWPAFTQDLILAAFAAALLMGFPLALALLPLIGMSFAFRDLPSQAWRDTYLREAGFDERNFNKTLAEHPSLFMANRLIRMPSPVSGEVSLPNGPVIVFLLLDGSAKIGDVSLDNCRRLGSLSTSEGPYLMDAQACRIRGKARILIGTQSAAAAIAIPTSGSEAIIILDSAFLSQKAPKVNAEWLLRQTTLTSPETRIHNGPNKGADKLMDGTQ